MSDKPKPAAQHQTSHQNIAKTKLDKDSVDKITRFVKVQTESLTWDSYGRKATLISFKVLTILETLDLPISAKRPSGQAMQANIGQLEMAIAFFVHSYIKCFNVCSVHLRKAVSYVCIPFHLNANMQSTLTVYTHTNRLSYYQWRRCVLLCKLRQHLWSR